MLDRNTNKNYFLYRLEELEVQTWAWKVLWEAFFRLVVYFKKEIIIFWIINFTEFFFEYFQGQLQSCVQLSNGEPTATLQPFFTLPLDIQSKNIKNVSDALIHNFTSEALDGYVIFLKIYEGNTTFIKVRVAFVFGLQSL